MLPPLSTIGRKHTCWSTARRARRTRRRPAGDAAPRVARCVVATRADQRPGPAERRVCPGLPDRVSTRAEPPRLKAMRHSWRRHTDRIEARGPGRHGPPQRRHTGGEPSRTIKAVSPKSAKFGASRSRAPHRPRPRRGHAQEPSHQAPDIDATSVRPGGTGLRLRHVGHRDVLLEHLLHHHTRGDGLDRNSRVIPRVWRKLNAERSSCVESPRDRSSLRCGARTRGRTTSATLRMPVRATRHDRPFQRVPGSPLTYISRRGQRRPITQLDP